MYILNCYCNIGVLKHSTLDAFPDYSLLGPRGPDDILVKGIFSPYDLIYGVELFTVIFGAILGIAANALLRTFILIA